MKCEMFSQRLSSFTNDFHFQALDKCQLGHLVRAKEEKLEFPG